MGTARSGDNHAKNSRPRRAPPSTSAKPYRDRNGIAIIETAELSNFFDEFGIVRKELAEEEQKEQKELEKLARQLDSPKISMINKFIDEPAYRAKMLKILSKFSIHLVAGFVSFLNKCVDETWARSAPSGAFEGYNQNLTILLDIAVAFPVERFPPALFQTVAHGLERVGPYVGNSPGQSYSAKRTWDDRCKDLKPEVIKELESVATQYRYSYLIRLVRSIHP